MSQRQQLERFFEIDRQIRAGMFPNAKSLAEELEVGPRVIFVDRKFMLERLNAPIENDRKRGGWFYSDQTWILPNVMVNEGELLAFFLSVEVAQRYLGTTFQEPLLSAVSKMSQTIRGSVLVDLETLRTNYTFVPPPIVTVDAKTLLALHHAIQEHWQVEILYYAATRDEEKMRVCDPYHLYNVGGNWYVIAFDHLRNGIRTFHIGRIKSWRTLKSKFVIPPEFSIKDWVSGAFQAEGGGPPVEVVVWFDEHQARWIRERQWHGTAKLEPQPDGSLILRLHTSGLGEVKRWLMQYGSHAVVMKPEGLRQEVAEEAQRMVTAYSDPRAQQFTSTSTG
jgi:predicted DNA-binding transcriptional regulator YafY